MRLVFLEDVADVAKAGEIKEVADGYGRNFLIPKKLAVIATPSELEKVERQQLIKSQREAHSEEEMKALAETLQDLTITFKARTGAQGRLYGSITGSDIAKEVLRVTGYGVDRRKIKLEEPIRKLGSYEVQVRLLESAVPRLKVIVEEEEV